LLIVSAAMAGILSRRFPGMFPEFVARFAGDTLWSFALYFFISFLFPALSTGKRIVVTYTLSFLDEVSQLYHAPWIDALRQTVPGALILGNTFIWSDLACYLAGTLLAGLSGYLLERST
jgi:hypothetical protein